VRSPPARLVSLSTTSRRRFGALHGCLTAVGRERCPVIKAALSDARNTMVCAISSGVPSRGAERLPTSRPSFRHVR